MRKRFDVACGWVLAGMLVASVEGATDVCPDAKQPKEASSNAGPSDLFYQLEHDIPSLYLINGLYLSQEQAGKLVALLENAKSVDDRCGQKSAKIVKSRRRDLEKEQGEIIQMAARRSAVDLKKLDRSAGSKRLHKAREEIGELKARRHEERGKLADKAFELLTDSQQKIVKNFVPCFIPPGDFRNPERVGQAVGDTSEVEKILAVMRKTLAEKDPAAALRQALDSLVPYVLQKRYTPYSDEAAKSVRDEISIPLKGMVPRLKELNDSSFEMEKKALAAKVFSLHNPDDPDSIRWKVGHYILNTCLLDVIQARAAGAKEMAAAAPTAGPKDSEDLDARDKLLKTAALLRGLDLTPEQAGKMLSLVRSAQTAKAKIDADIAAAMEEALEKYGVLRHELAAGQATGESESKASGCHGKVKRLRDETTTEEMLKCEADMDQSLTAEQVAFLSGKAQEVTPRDSDLEAVEKSMNSGRRLLADIRRETGMDFAARKDELCRDFVKTCIKEQDVEAGAIDVDLEAKRIGEAVDRIRALNQTDYNARREDLAAELCPRRTQPRPPVYGPHYENGKPVPILGAGTKLILLCDATREILGKMAPRSDR